MKNILYDEFRRRYRITGSKTTVNQDYRLIKQFCDCIANKYPEVTKLSQLNNNHCNAFYNEVKNGCWCGEISKSYLKDTLYSVNKLFKAIEKPELVYDVSKLLKSFEGKKKITVTLEEFNNIKAWRRKYGKVLPPK